MYDLIGAIFSAAINGEEPLDQFALKDTQIMQDEKALSAAIEDKSLPVTPEQERLISGALYDRERVGFIDGFRLGVQLMMAGMDGSTWPRKGT